MFILGRGIAGIPHFHKKSPKLSDTAGQIPHFNPLPDNKILDWSELKQSADDSFEFDVNNRKFSKLVENTVGKGEIARYEQFLLYLQCFQKACFPGASKGVIVWEWVKSRRYNIQNKTNFSYSRKFRVSKYKQNAYRKDNLLVLCFS